jgi:hypothetical protein
MTNSQKLIDDFKQLRECFIILRRDFNTYNALFCDENRSLLTAVAPTFFSDISEILQRDWILQVVKLMDAAVTNVRGKNRENLTIKLINEQLENESLITEEIRIKTEEILEYGNFLTPARHRSLAHRDRECHVENIPLGATTAEQLELFIKNIQVYSDLVGIQIGVGPLDFSSSGCRGDVYDFLRYLRKGQNAQPKNQADEK